MHEKLSGHICLAKALVPLLKEDSAVSYTVVTGMLGEVCPWPEAALTTIGNAATYGLVAALQAELRDQPQRVNEVRSLPLVSWLARGRCCNPLAADRTASAPRVLARRTCSSASAASSAATKPRRTRDSLECPPRPSAPWPPS